MGFFDLISSRLRPRTAVLIALAFITLAIMVYQSLSPLAYGLQWTRGKCERAKWGKHWDFAWYVICNLLEKSILTVNSLSNDFHKGVSVFLVSALV